MPIVNVASAHATLATFRGAVQRNRWETATLFHVVAGPTERAAARSGSGRSGFVVRRVALRHVAPPINVTQKRVADHANVSPTATRRAAMTAAA
jgi:hypothetical protein